MSVAAAQLRHMSKQSTQKYDRSSTARQRDAVNSVNCSGVKPRGTRPAPPVDWNASFYFSALKEVWLIGVGGNSG